MSTTILDEFLDGRGNFHWHGAFGVGCGKFKIAECVFPLGSSSVAILNFPHPTPLPAEFAAPFSTR